MKRRRPLEALNAAAMGLWLGIIVMTAATAARIFPIVKGLDPLSPKYAAYTGEHWRIIAGQVANRVFLDADTLQAVCGLIAVGTLGAISLRGRLTPVSLVVRWLTLLLALSATGYSLLVLRPRMEGNAHGLWDSAMAGMNEAAQQYQEAFSADHPRATMAMSAAAVALVLALVGAAVSAEAPPKEVGKA